MWLDVTNTAICAENLKTQVLKCVTMRYSWRGELRPHRPVFSATLCCWQCSYHRWASLQLSTSPAPAALGTQRCCGSSDRRRQNASPEVERREMSSSKRLSCPERGPPGAMTCAKAALASQADGHTRWHLARRSAATHASPQQSSVTSNEPSLETPTNQKSKKVACTSVSCSLTCSPIMWLTI